MDLIAIEKQYILYFLENMPSKQTKFILKNYNGLLEEGNTNYRAHRGVPNLVHDTFPYQTFILTTSYNP